MKILLAGLMCSILGVTQCWAIDGGPVYGGGAPLTVTGNYAGVLIPIPTVLNPGPPPVTLTDNSLALFTLSITRVGLATGISAVFRNGIFYPGTISGVADPDSAKVYGIIAATQVVSSTGPNGTSTTQTTYNANGQLDKVKVVPNQNQTSTADTRLRGEASLTYVNDQGDPNGDSGGPIKYKVKAFKQSQVTS
jgi:hypothetical protein